MLLYVRIVLMRLYPLRLFKPASKNKGGLFECNRNDKKGARYRFVVFDGGSKTLTVKTEECVGGRDSKKTEIKERILKVA